MSGWSLGPGHRDYGHAAETLPPPTPREQHAPRRGRPPRRAPAPPAEIVVMAGTVHDAEGRPRHSLTQILMGFAAEHKQRAGGACACVFCTDLRWHIDQKRQASGGSDGR